MSLELVPLDDILAELDRRYDQVVVALNRDRDGRSSDYRFHFYGNRFACLGMVSQVAADLEEDIGQTKVDRHELED